jgi:hypothetical protein
VVLRDVRHRERETPHELVALGSVGESGSAKLPAASGSRLHMQLNSLHLMPIADVDVCSFETPHAEKVLPAGHAPNAQCDSVSKRNRSRLEKTLAMPCVPAASYNVPSESSRDSRRRQGRRHHCAIASSASLYMDGCPQTLDVREGRACSRGLQRDDQD